MYAGSGLFPKSFIGHHESVIGDGEFDRSKLGQQEYAKQWRFQGVPAPQDLGATAPIDNQFASTYGERPLEVGWDRPIPGRDIPTPLWNEQSLKHVNARLRYRNNFLTNATDSVDLRNANSRQTNAPPQLTNRSLVSISMTEM